MSGTKASKQKRNEREHKFRVLLTQMTTFSKLKEGSCCVLTKLMFQTGEKRGGLFLKQRQKWELVAKKWF